jgi:hypothetical protein
MRILALQPVAIIGGGSLRTLAEFDIELNGEIRIYGARLLEGADGRRIVYGPSSGQRRVVTFAVPLAEQITTAASKSYGEALIANGASQHAA